MKLVLLKNNQNDYKREGLLHILLCLWILCYNYADIHYRDNIIKLIGRLKESLKLIQTLKVAIDDKHKLFDNTCGLIERIGSPKQIVSFLLWITKNADQLSQVR